MPPDEGEVGALDGAAEMNPSAGTSSGALDDDGGVIGVGGAEPAATGCAVGSTAARLPVLSMSGVGGGADVAV